MGYPVGLVDLNVYIPEGFMSSQEIAAATGIPVDVIERKFGLKGKHIAAPDEHVSDLAVKAARPLLEKVPPENIDAVIYFGSPLKDYQVWLCAPKIQHELGAVKAYSFELCGVSAGFPIALKVARDMLVADGGLNTILLVGASKESRLLNYANHRSRFMFNFGDGAAAALLRRGHPSNQVLGFTALTDGTFHHCVMVPAGGTVYPPSRETVERGMHFIDVADPKDMKARLDPVSLPNFVRVVRGALEISGRRVEDLDFLAPLHTKRSMFEALLAALGLREDQSFYLDQYGHMSAIDPLVALYEGRRHGLLRDGDLAVAVSVGTGYTWSAIALQWGQG